MDASFRWPDGVVIYAQAVPGHTKRVQATLEILNSVQGVDMKLYYSKGACSLAARIIINELGLNCEYDAVDLKTKRTESGMDFLTFNAKGSVPVLEIKEGEVLTENAVIQQYLADQQSAYQLLPKVGDFKRYRVLEWLNYISTELHKGFGPLFNATISPELKEQIFVANLNNKFSFVNKHLEQHPYLCGDHFTLPDAYLFVMIFWGLIKKLNIQQWPALNKYFDNLQQRKAIIKSLLEENLQLNKLS